METYSMARRSKHEYLQVMWPRYQRAGRAEKTMLLDEFTRCVGIIVRMRSGCSTGRCPSRHAPGVSRGGRHGTARR
jgi:hypothetical protein